MARIIIAHNVSFNGFLMMQVASMKLFSSMRSWLIVDQSKLEELVPSKKGTTKLDKEVKLSLKAKKAERTGRELIIMFKKLFKKPKNEPSALATLERLHESLELLEKKERVLQKKISMETEKAKEYTRLKNKKAAILCLKRKKLYESQVEQIGNFQLRLHDQMILLEGAKATTETVDALRSGAHAMKSMQKAVKIDDVDKTMDDINEQTENMKQIQDVLSAPIAGGTEFDDDELEAELEELEEQELEKQLLRPGTSLPPTRLPSVPAVARASHIPARAQPQRTTREEDELAALQAEMTL
ncbi:hypothetical protein GOP47_0024928 [Adiantum capillus-veneris]|uniref:Uncharacterized protein n=1 Tax=Adiantum capillus-veneris TaxID=13818 RepID=A0A9D4U304_ADICA|nr:hypothetical protein GOP47_0024928 [Adiantum capillus-veneris]